MTDQEDWQKPVVFYDGGCPLCRREIAHYRRIDGDRQLCWIDIHAQPETLQAYVSMANSELSPKHRD